MSSSLLISPVSAPAAPAATATGLGSGINISAMVSGLIATESGAQTAQYTSQTTKASADLTALGTLKNALYSFQTSVQTLQNVSTFQVLKNLGFNRFTLVRATFRQALYMPDL